ncbi:MAG: patatin-like phospholipase family protein [Terracidiphilus sp.]
MRTHSTILVCCSAFGLLLHPGSGAQQRPEADRPTVGVALSGGSALGLAHIGVLRYFEEHHIPVDKIGGTSMGGLIGGLFATGMDSSQIRATVESADWNGLLNPSLRFADQSIEEKQKWNRTFGDFTLRFGKGFSLPSGLNPGESLSLLLSQSTMAYSGVRDFDQLPIPFRCVATDLVSGDSIVFSKGSLPTAMRATMSLPGVFTPVKLDRMVLVDGGVLENIPVDAVRDMGAKVVIAVAFETPTVKPNQFKSFSDVMGQTISLVVTKNEKRSLAKADLVISVDTKRFSGTDYKRWSEIIEAGYQAAKAHDSELGRLELSQPEWEAYLTQRRARMRFSSDKGRVLAVSSPDLSFQRNAQAEIHRSIGDRVVSENELERNLSGMVAATAVPGAAFEWQQEGSTPGGYTVRFSERPSDRVLVRVSAQYAVSSGEPSRFGLKVSTSLIPRNAYKTQILSTASLGYDPTLQMEAYKPFGGSQYFIASQVFGGRTHFNSYTGPHRQSDTRDEFGGAIYAGIGTWRFAQFRLGGRAGYDWYSRPVVIDGISSHNGGFTVPEARWIVNHQDSGGLPTRGTRFEGEAGYFLRSTGDYPFVHSDLSTFQPLNRGVTLFALNNVGTSFGRKLNYYDQFIVGDQTNMAAFRYQEFHANTLVTAGSGVVLHGPPIRHVSAHPGLALWYEAGRFDAGSAGWSTHQSASIGAFFPTQVGATGVELSFDENGKARFRLMLGSF